MQSFIRSGLFICFLLTLHLPVRAKAILQGTVSFLNSGSRPAAGVKISAFGANDCYTTDSGMFSLEFPDKKPGDKVKIIVGSNDKHGIPLELVNDKVLAQVRIPSNPDDDIVEIIVCKIGQRNEAALRYNGVIVKTINENMEKRFREINEKLDVSKTGLDRIEAMQNERVKLISERDEALAKAEEQALFIASINLDKSSQLVREAVLKVDQSQDITGAIAILDNEILLKSYEAAKEKIKISKAQIDQVIEGLKLKIKLLGINFQNAELNVCCLELEKIYKEQDSDAAETLHCFEWTTLDQREIESLSKKQRDLQPQNHENSNGNNAVAKIEFGTGSCSQIGDVAVDFTLKNVDGRMVSLSDYNHEKGIILVFTSNYCPYSQLYEQRIIDLHRKFAPLGYPVIAINPSSPVIVPEDSFEKMQARAKEKRYPFVYLVDEQQSVYPKFGATRTPHVFVLDEKRRVRYIGAIDNNAEDPNSNTRRYVEDAVQALLKGEKPPVELTRAIGVTVKKAPDKRG